ncbi:MAG: C4-dicarboxylate ABC transporter [Gemmatimonadota bacterium]|jgi:Na+/H+ antiporter NhaC|nr:MAG: C4-dicarboxylate ABC transporter [Gemmatimonadota bacterium]
MPDYGALSLLPPLLAIALAVQTREVYLSLAAGIWLAWTIVAGWDPLAGAARAVNETVAVLGEPGNARILLFTFMVGSLIAIVQANGGVEGFVGWVERRRWVTNARRARLLAWVIGILIFIESNITILVTGSVCRPLFDRFRVSREKLAYLADSTSAPVCILIPFNAWGGYVLGLLAALGVAAPLGVFLAAIPLNFYALGAVMLAGATAAFGLDWGPMRAAEARTRRGELHWEHAGALADPEEIAPPAAPGVARRPANLILPVATMVLAMPVGMYITGRGSLAAGSGSLSVLWAVIAAVGVASVLTLGQRLLPVQELSRVSLRGAGGLTGMALVLLLAIALGAATVVLGTGEFIAGLVAGRIPLPALLPLIFLAGAATSFATGSSWGTFAIMIPVAVPLALSLGLPVAPFAAAVLSGGIFGDHCSPISDTTIIASLAAASDHIEHVRTQLPYALTAGAFALAAFAATGGVLAL